MGMMQCCESQEEQKAYWASKSQSNGNPDIARQKVGDLKLVAAVWPDLKKKTQNDLYKALSKMPGIDKAHLDKIAGRDDDAI